MCMTVAGVAAAGGCCIFGRHFISYWLVFGQRIGWLGKVICVNHVKNCE